MSAVEDVGGEQARALLGLYDRTLPQVYGYLLRRTSDADVAEDLAAETFLAAVSSIRSGACGEVTPAWLIGIARHKLMDHWRRLHREQRNLTAVAAEPDTSIDDPWDVHIDATLARQALATLGPHHRSALTLRYVDGLGVDATAALLERTVHATEALLVRARRAFTAAYAALDPTTTPRMDGGATDGR